MIVVALKDYILHEEVLGGYKIRVLRLDTSNAVELEVERDSRLMVRKKMDSLEKAKRFLDKIREKFKKKPDGNKFNLKDKKEARLNSDNPKAFLPGSPSENPFQDNGGGGLLDHVQRLKDTKNPYNRKRRRKPTRQRAKWDETSGGEKDDGIQLSRWGPENGPSRDSGPDRPGFERALGNENEGSRPPIPTGEDSIDVAKNPQDYKTNYDAGYPGDRDTEQDVEDKARHRKSLEKQKELQRRKETFTVIYEQGGEKEKVVNLTLQEALRRSRMYPGSEIVKN